MNVGIVRCCPTGEVGEVACQAKVSGFGKVDSTCDENLGTTNEMCNLGSDFLVTRWFEARCDSIPPSAELAPDVSHDELWLVIERSQIRLL